MKQEGGLLYEKIFENIANHYRNSFLIFAALICIGLFVDYDDHIENGRYTYVPEDDNKDNAYVEFNLSDYDKRILNSYIIVLSKKLF